MNSMIHSSLGSSLPIHVPRDQGKMGNRSVFRVQRVEKLEDRIELADEIGKNVLSFYASPQGKELLQAEPLAFDNKELWGNIQNKLSRPNYLALVVRDESQDLQAIAVVIPPLVSRYLYLGEMATAPQNLGKNGKRRGAGTAALMDAASLCIEKNYPGIEGLPIESAKLFYEKFGFKVEKMKEGRILTETFQILLDKYDNRE